MFITIHCLGMPFNGDTINERSLGGSETAAYYMARELTAQGHKVTLFNNTDQYSEKDGVRYIPMGAITEATPLGEDFHHYSMNTIVDVLIIQRHPLAFQYPWASKINLLWLHDLASRSTKAMMGGQLPFIDGILTVSEWHKQQVVDVWGLNPDIVMPIQNGVDLSLYEDDGLIGDGRFEFGIDTNDQVKLLYSSRPERGLENLVMVDGIMERLAKEDPKYHLYVCCYDNVVPQMTGYYEFLFNRCAELPNVTVLGHLTKQELADVQRQCDLCIYPTSFEETSCITAMECMAAGLPLLSSRVGALPETAMNCGAVLVDTLENDEDYRGMELRVDGKADIGAFVSCITTFVVLGNTKLQDEQLTEAPNFAWSVSAEMLMGHVWNILNDSRTITGYMKECLRNSDIYALNEFIQPDAPSSPVADGIINELEECYGFAFNNKWGPHYAAYYEYEKNRGVNYGPENLDGNSRFEFVTSLVHTCAGNSNILDYGCAHGHYTVNLAKRFPQFNFVGVDIAQSNVEKARAWAAEEGITNATFHCGSVNGTLLELDTEDGNGTKFYPELTKYDLIIAAEVLEHLESPAQCADTLSQHLNGGGKMVITVPYGPWESQGYKEHHPWRAHVHHLDRQDLHELFGMHDDFNIIVVPAGQDAYGATLGSYVAVYNKPTESSGVVDYARKFNQSKPRQTVSLCMIAKDAQGTIERTLHSVVDIVDEVIVGVDETSDDDTAKRIRMFCEQHRIPCVLLRIKSPTKQGFDAARNETIEHASCDWILWLDSDEVLTNAKGLARYLRHNQFNGYAIAQHHFSMQPAGIMKTDLPVRVFRNNVGIKFHGVVHEHPEQKINEGVGHVINLPAIAIGHYGYTDEGVRRDRFQRNIELLLRDREQNPERKLGKFLWLRDLAQMCGFDAEQNGARITHEMIDRAKRGMEVFEELLEDETTLRMAIDGLDFYSGLSRILGGGFDFEVKVGDQVINAHFYKKEHLKKIIDLVINEKVVNHEQTKYL